MAKQVIIEFSKTYASIENAQKAVAKVCGEEGSERWIAVPVLDGTTVRYGVLFVGMPAVEAGLHFHFNVIA